MRYLSSLLKVQALAVVTLVPFALASAASAMTLKGAAQDYNLFLFEDWNQYGGDVEGRAAVGGNATLQGVGIGDRLANTNGSDTHLVVGGNLEFRYNSGQVFGGNAVVGGSVTGRVNYNCGGCSTQTGEPIDFAAAAEEYRALSDYLFGLEETGSQNLISGSNQLQLAGSGTGTHVFNVDLDNVREIFLDASSQSDLVVINVANASYASQITSMFHTEANADSSKWDNVIWNFNQATELDLRNLSWRGTILAPDAHLKLQSGNIEGQTIARSATLSNWSGEFHNYYFEGKLPDINNTPVPTNDTLPVQVPEPSVWVGLVLLGAAAAQKRRRIQCHSVLHG